MRPVAATVDVLANDQADRDAVVFALVVDPCHEATVVNADPTVTSTHAGFTGGDRFRYKTCTPRPSQCSSATVTVEVRPPGD